KAFDAANNVGTSLGVAVTVSNAAPAPAVVDMTLALSAASVARGQNFSATAKVTNGGGTSATGLSVVISFTPSTAMRLSSPQSATQAVASVAAGGSTNVVWQLRADNAASGTMTMTLKDSTGATLKTVSLPITITN